MFENDTMLAFCLLTKFARCILIVGGRMMILALTVTVLSLVYGVCYERN